MKTFILTFVLFFFQGGDKTLEDIAWSIKTGSAKNLVAFCNTSVEIKMNNDNKNYSKNQAEQIFKNFFTENPPKSFSYIHKGSSPEGLKYTIARYVGSNGNYRIVVFLKKVENSYLVDTINFNKE